MALFFFGIVSMLAAVPIAVCSLFLSYLHPRFAPSTAVLAIALMTAGIGAFVLSGGVWYNWFLPIPLSVPLFSASSIAISHRANRLRNLRRGLCAACDYDLGHGEHDACPECGRLPSVR